LTEDVANQGSDPALHAERRADLRFLDIDSALMPFSIKTLRQKEIAAVLVPALARAAAAPPPTSVGERTKLEVAALIACSLDSGRSLPDLLRLPVTVQREGPLTLSLGGDETVIGTLRIRMPKSTYSSR